MAMSSNRTLSNAKALYANSQFEEAFKLLFSILPNNEPKQTEEAEIYFYLAACTINLKEKGIETSVDVETYANYLALAKKFYENNRIKNNHIIACSDYFIGIILNKYRQEDSAIPHLTEAVKYFTSHTADQLQLQEAVLTFYKINALFNLLEALVLQKRFIEASNVISQLNSIRDKKQLNNPILDQFNWSLIDLLYGVALYSQGKTDDAIDVFLKVIECSQYSIKQLNINPDKSVHKEKNQVFYCANKAAYYLAHCYNKKEEYNKVIDILEHVSQIANICTTSTDNQIECNIIRDYLHARALFKSHYASHAQDIIFKALEKITKADSMNFTISESLIFDLYYLASEIYQAQHNTERQISMLEKAISLISVDDKEIAKANFVLGELKYTNFDYENALINLKIAFEYYKNSTLNTDKFFIARIAHLIGSTYLRLKEYQSAYNYFYKSKEYFTSLDNETDAMYSIIVNVELGRVCNILHQYTEAIKYLSEANIQLAARFYNNDNKQLIAAISQQMGYSFLRIHQFDKAQIMLAASAKVFMDGKRPFEVASTYIGLALSLYMQNNIVESNKYCSQALTLINELQKIDPSSIQRYRPVLNMWLSNYTFGNGPGKITNFLKLMDTDLSVKLEESGTSSMIATDNNTNGNCGITDISNIIQNIGVDKFNIFKDIISGLVKNDKWGDNELAFFIDLDPGVTDNYLFYIREPGKKPANSLQAFNILQILNNHSKNCNPVNSFNPPVLLAKENLKMLLPDNCSGKRLYKKRLLIANPNALWISLLPTKAILKTDISILNKLNSFSNDKIVTILTTWKDSLATDSFAGLVMADFETLDYLYTNRHDLFNTKRNIFKLIKDLAFLRRSVRENEEAIHDKLKTIAFDEVDDYLKIISYQNLLSGTTSYSHLCPNLFKTTSTIHPEVLKTWRAIIKERSLNNYETGREDQEETNIYILKILQLRWLKTGLTTKPLYFTKSQIDCHRFKDSFKIMLEYCPDAEWYSYLAIDSFDLIKPSTLKSMICELTAYEFNEFNQFWQINYPGMSFIPRSKEYEDYKLQAINSFTELDAKLVALQNHIDKQMQLLSLLDGKSRLIKYPVYYFDRHCEASIKPSISTTDVDTNTVVNPPIYDLSFLRKRSPHDFSNESTSAFKRNKLS